MKIELHKKIRSIRELRGFSQMFLAEKLNITQKAYSKIELGKTQLNWNRLNEIADILSVSIFDLIDTTKDIDDVNLDNEFEDQTIKLFKQVVDKYETQVTELQKEIERLKAMIND